MKDILQELNLLTEFVREQYPAIGVSLDYGIFRKCYDRKFSRLLNYH
jgi:hypothetical protein